MSTLFAQLMEFFGLSGMPATFAELIPWLFQVLCAVGLFLFLFGMIRSIVSTINRTARW